MPPTGTSCDDIPGSFMLGNGLFAVVRYHNTFKKAALWDYSGKTRYGSQVAEKGADEPNAKDLIGYTMKIRILFTMLNQ